jgi:hypothetical protein
MKQRTQELKAEARRGPRGQGGRGRRRARQDRRDAGAGSRHGRAAPCSQAAGWAPVGSSGTLASLRAAAGRGPFLEFITVEEPKRVKNRLHLDVAPSPGEDHAAEVARLRALGATPVDVGQRGVAWVVLADPEGNEFCVLTPR